MSKWIETSSGSRYVFSDDGRIYRQSDWDIIGAPGDTKTAVFVEAINGPKVGEHMVLVSEDGYTAYTTPVTEIR